MNDARHFVAALDIHASHACNLRCESCLHFSNQGHTGALALDEAAEWLGAWRPRIRPGVFSIVGGEPTLNPDLTRLVQLAKSTWPEAMIGIITNGFFLHRHPDLPRALARDPQTALFLSIHHDSDDYLHALEPVVALLRRWKSRFRLNVFVRRSHEDWTRRYHGLGDSMLPFEDESPRRSWENCACRDCRQLFDGRLWKCPPVAYLKLQARKYRLGEAWLPYLAYEGLPPTCSDEELRSLLSAEDEPVCSMCPAQPEHFRMKNPLPMYRERPAGEAKAAGSPAARSAASGAVLRDLLSLGHRRPRAGEA